VSATGGLPAGASVLCATGCLPASGRSVGAAPQDSYQLRKERQIPAHGVSHGWWWRLNTISPSGAAHVRL